MQEKPLSAADKGHVNTNGPEKAPPYVLLPGDPDRVVTMTQQWDGIRNVSDRALMPPQVWTLARQAKCAVGTYMGAPIGAWSTGIGGPSAEFTLHEILDKGGETFIRVGTEIPPSSRAEGLRLLHGLATNLATSLQTPQEA